MVRHINPNDPGRTATAPYNFVPLPNKIFSVEEGIEVNGKKVQPWKMHDQFVPGTRSGWIDLKITTLTPLFIRGAAVQTDGEWDRRDTRLRPEPYVNNDGVPVIPGSSLRGMIRSLVEVLSFSKISPVTDERPFFRTVAKDRIGIAYRNRMIHSDQKPQGGYVRKRRNQWVIVPATEVLRVHRDKLNICGLNIPIIQNPSYYPNWNGQQKPCWFRRDSLKRWMVEDFSLEHQAGWEEGVLVLTGSAPNKKHEFVFVGEIAAKPVEIPEGIWRRFHDEDQLTQWQEKAFIKDKPSPGCRKAKGHLRDGEPVFFLADDLTKSEENPDGLLFFGRAQMFRFPYDQSPWDLIPEKLKNAGLDMAEALFGLVTQGWAEQDCAIKGRLFFEDSAAIGEDFDWFENIMVPHILASPKVTCFQHYLTQDGTKNSTELTTYLVGDHTTIRGTKNYWHRWNDVQGLAVVKEEVNKHDDLLKDLLKKETKEITDSQHTVIRPVKENVVFFGRVRFENLSDIELGAFLAALDLPEGLAHKLGMGKPLGLGSVRIDPKLFLVDREIRYESWGNNGVNIQDAHVFLDAFEKQIIEHARNSLETIDTSKSGLWQIGRLQALFYLLGWNTKPPLSETDYMPLERFQNRPILPTPHLVCRKQEPSWPIDPPKKGAQQAVATKTKSLESPCADISVTKHTVIPKAFNPKKDILKGQHRNGFLMRKGEIWIAMFEGDDREAVILNTDAIPKDAIDNDIAEFYIMEQSKKIGIRVRFNKLAIKK